MWEAVVRVGRPGCGPPLPPHNSFGKWTWMELVIRAGCLLSVGLPYLVIWSWVGQGRVVYWEALEIGPDKYKRGGGSLN